MEDGIARFHASVQSSGPINDLTIDPITFAWADMVQSLYEYKFSLACAVSKRGVKASWWPVVRRVPSEQLALITLTTAFDSIGSATSNNTPAGSVTQAQLANKIADGVEHHMMHDALVKANQEKYGASMDVSDFSPRRLRMTLAKAGKVSGFNLDRRGRTALGALLIDRLVSGTGLFELSAGPRTKGHRSVIIVRPHEKLIEWLDGRSEHLQLLRPLATPMIAPPLPWEGNDDGGYYTLRQPLVKTPRVAGAALPDPVIKEAVNYMQDVPYRIDNVAATTANALWASGRGGGGLPKSAPEPLPELVDEFTSEEHKQEVLHTRRLIHEANARSVGKRVAAHQSVRQAMRLRKEPALWYPWNCDFRSRIYSAPCSVNPQGADYQKSMLQFADGYEIGDRGLHWLKVHLANCFGIDKVSFDDRVSWADDLMEDLSQRDFDPLDWQEWEDADKPFDALTTAAELHAALRLDNPSRWISRKPIGQDGSCNGLQHLLAMGRDEVAGAEVNLVDGPKPGDVYSLVLDKVVHSIQSDIMAGNPHAAAWLKVVSRKTVKRGVMTTPYGVTFRGIRDQLISDRFTKGLEGKEYRNADYLARMIQMGIGDTITTGTSIMEWLKEAARIICRESNAPVRWTTPLGFNVVQYYVKPRSVQVDVVTPNGRQRIRLRHYDKDQPLDVRRAANGIVPNFVHALDACHLMAVALRLKDLGILHFLPVHDSFAVHPHNVDTMREVITDEFANLHQHNPLVQFKDSTEYTLGVSLPDLPTVGNLDIGDVRNSTYLFN